MANFIGGQWSEGSGDLFVSTSPATNVTVWQGKSSSSEDIDRAMTAARKSCGKWWDTPLPERLQVVKDFAEKVAEKKKDLAALISRETGKPLWECHVEAASVAAKVDITIEAMRQRAATTSFDMPDTKAVTRFKPHGVCAVLGPFNFPAHLPNGHIVPALIMGNPVVFKPSEQTPAVGAWMIEKWQQAGVPDGVINLVQGGPEAGQAIVGHAQLDGLFFTGSSRAGVAIHKALAGQPAKILALEMGGNNPLIVHEAHDLTAAAYLTILSAYMTAGQRCSCARRLILVDGKPAEQFIDTLVRMIEKVSWEVPSTVPEPFMGTVISATASEKLQQVQSELIEQGGRSIIEMKAADDCPALLSPGLVDVTGILNSSDEETFGPLLKISRVANFDAAIDEANRTAFGLSAALLSDDSQVYQRFIHRIRAGVVNWNRQTTRASGKLPFGGCGLSGNHRPGGSWAVDYCSWPVASLESETLAMPNQPLPGIDLS